MGELAPNQENTQEKQNVWNIPTWKIRLERKNLGYKVIQWNCHGLRTNSNELLLWLITLDPMVICREETFLKNEDHLNITDYQQYNPIHNKGLKTSGGVSISIENNLPQTKIEVKTDIQAVAERATLHKTLNICSQYIPPHEQIESKLEDLIRKISKPFILFGDLYWHTTL